MKGKAKKKKKRKEEKGWGGWGEWVGGRQLHPCRVLVPSRLSAGGSSSTGRRRLAGHPLPTPASRVKRPSAAPRPPATGHEGERGGESTHLGGSQGPSPAASCQSDPLPSITSFFREMEYFCWL